MSIRRSLLRVTSALVAVVVVGLVGYIGIEGWTPLDAFYMTIITVSTVGFGEVHPLSEEGKIFSAFLIVGGVGVALYTFTTVMDYLVKGELGNVFRRRRMKQEIGKLTGHFILCGYGRVGRSIAECFQNEGTEFVVIEPDSHAVADAETDGRICLQGDAADYEVLRSAGIDRARGLVAATDSDSANVFIIVTARELNRDLYIVARAGRKDSESRLEAVGATRAINPYYSGGQRMARLALYPLVTDFIDRALRGHGEDLGLEDLEITPDSVMAGRTVADAQDLGRGASILALRKRGSGTLPKPPDQTRIDVGDRLVILGTRKQLRLVQGKE